MSVPRIKTENKARERGVRICHRPWTKKTPKLYLSVHNVRKINKAIIQAKKHILTDDIYPEQRFRSHYQKCFMQPSNTEHRKSKLGS